MGKARKRKLKKLRSHSSTVKNKKRVAENYKVLKKIKDNET